MAVSERYSKVEGILDNVLRFQDNKMNRQMLCEQMYWGIRREFAKELLGITDAGGDAYTRLSLVISKLEETIK